MASRRQQRKSVVEQFVNRANTPSPKNKNFIPPPPAVDYPGDNEPIAPLTMTMNAMGSVGSNNSNNQNNQNNQNNHNHQSRRPQKPASRRESLQSVKSASGIMSLFRHETIDVNGNMMTSPDKSMKYIFVTGSMLSNSGKNTATASIGKKLQDLGHNVTVIKVDNYLNVDFGLLSPVKFGEVFVFNDGTECHYDCGIYERYLNIELTWKHHITLGKILDYINLNERNGKFYGNVITMKNEQVIDIICQWIYNVAHVPIKKLHVKQSEKNIPQRPNVCIVDFGGFVEDNESDLFLQAMKHFQRYYVDNRDQCYLHMHFGYIIEHAIDSTNNRNKSMQLINQYSETAERCLHQHLLPKRLVPDMVILRFEGRRHQFGDYQTNIPSIQETIIRKFYNLLVFGYNSNRFITNKMKQAGMDGSESDLAEAAELEMRLKVIELPNLDTIYAIPEFLLHNTALFDSICDKFKWPQIDKGDIDTNGDFWEVFDRISRQGPNAGISGKVQGADIFQQLAMKVRSIEREVTIGLVGKYGTDDLTYLSLIEALKLSALSVNVQINIKVISSEELETYQEKLEYQTYPQTGSNDNAVVNNQEIDENDFNSTKFEFMENKTGKIEKDDDFMDDDSKLNTSDIEFDERAYNDAWRTVYNMDGILVGGGFGVTGVVGIISVIKYCREKNVPFFGICFGMQLTCVEYARNVLNLTDANSIEINSACKSRLVVPMESHSNKEMNKFGHTMRLGSCTVKLRKDSLAYKLYDNNDVIYERHRHGYEVNPLYFNKLEEKGLIISGKDSNNKTAEIVELDTETLWKNHSYFIAAQYHPELIASAYKPSPLFTGLVLACKDRKFGKAAKSLKTRKSSREVFSSHRH